MQTQARRQELAEPTIAFPLEPTAAGTLLTRRTTWRRHLAPAFYFGWLQQQIIGRGQTRLLELIRERVSASEPSQYLAGEGQGADR
jgi:hypothetical protein